MNRQQRRKAEREGKRLVKKYDSVALLARQYAINEMCQGKYDTEFHRALANVYLDFRQGKISKAKYAGIVAGFVKPKEVL